MTDAIKEIKELEITSFNDVLGYNNNIHSQLLDLLEQRNLVIDDLSKQVQELQKPLLAVGTHSCSLAANTREHLAALTGAMPGKLPSFEYNYQNCSVTLVASVTG